MNDLISSESPGLSKFRVKSEIPQDHNHESQSDIGIKFL